MVKHVIVWKFQDGDFDKSTRAQQIKVALEGLVGKIDGLKEMRIYTDALASSSGDLMMDSTFESVDALAGYQKHPLHQEIANGLVRPSMQQRLSFDFEI